MLANKQASFDFLRFLQASAIALDPTVVRNLEDLTDDTLGDRMMEPCEMLAPPEAKGSSSVSTPDRDETKLGSTVESKSSETICHLERNDGP